MATFDKVSQHRAGMGFAGIVAKADPDAADGTLLAGHAQLAGEIIPPGASTAALGADSAGAAVLPAGTSSFYPTTGADDSKGVRIHATDAVPGKRISIGNGVPNKILKVYPVTGGTINGAAADAAFSSASGGGVTLMCLSATGPTFRTV